MFEFITGMLALTALFFDAVWAMPALAREYRNWGM
jgi:hypothetical protein